MLKILGKEEYIKYRSLFQRLSLEMEGINYVLDCPWIWDNAHIKKEDTVLDVGCGGGGLGLLAAKYCKQLYGIDRENYPRYYETCKKFNVNNAKFILSNAENPMPFDDEFFDVIISVSALEHNNLDEMPVENNPVNRAVREIYRVLKKGGIFVATVAVSPEGGYFSSEQQILDLFLSGTNFKLLDDSGLTGWRRESPEVSAKLKDFLAVYDSYQNWLPVGIILKKELTTPV